MAKRSKTAFGTIDDGIPDSLSIPDATSPMLPPPLKGSARRRGKKDPETKALQTSPAFDTSNFGLRDSLGGLQGGQSLDDTSDPSVLAELPSLSQTQTGGTAATQSMVPRGFDTPNPHAQNSFASFMFGPKSQRGVVDAGTVAVPGFGGASALEQQLQETLDGLNRGEKVGGLVAPDVPTLADSTAVDALGGDTAVDAQIRPPSQQNQFGTAVNGVPHNTPATGPGGTKVLDPLVAAKQEVPNNLPGGLAGSFRPPPKPMSEDYNVAAGNFDVGGADKLKGMSSSEMYQSMGITPKVPPTQSEPAGVTGAFGRPRPLADINSADLMSESLPGSSGERNQLGPQGDFSAADQTDQSHVIPDAWHGMLPSKSLVQPQGEMNPATLELQKMLQGMQPPPPAYVSNRISASMLRANPALGNDELLGMLNAPPSVNSEMPDMGKSIPDLGGGSSSGVGGAGAEMSLPPVQPRPTLDRTALTMSPQSDAGAFQTGPEQYGHPSPPPEPPSASEANRMGDSTMHKLLKGYGKVKLATAIGGGAALAYRHYKGDQQLQLDLPPRKPRK